MGTILMLKRGIISREFWEGFCIMMICIVRDVMVKKKKDKTRYPSLSLINQGSTSHLFWAQLMIGWLIFVTNYEAQVMNTTREK